MRDNSSTDIAWAAGLWEGEGTFCASRDAYLRVALQNTDPDVLERFAEIVGIGKIYNVRPDPRRPNNKPIQSWQASGEVAFRHIFELFLPYLGRRRRERALELLDLHGTYKHDMGIL